MAGVRVDLGTPRRWTVLLVEDSPADVTLWREALQQRRDISLEVYLDSEDALQHALGLGPIVPVPEPDLVLIDLKAPPLSGVEFLQAIRREERTRHLPVVGVTSVVSPEDIQAFYAEGGNGLVQLPLDLEAVLGRCRSIIDFWLDAATLPRERREPTRMDEDEVPSRWVPRPGPPPAGSGPA